MTLTRWRRPGAGEILLVYLLLATIGDLWDWLARGGAPQNLLWFLITAYLTWRVSRGSRISRMLLIIGGVVSYAVAVLAVARSWDPAVIALVVISAAQVVLLVSPPVYGRTRPAPITVRGQGWAQLIRRPPAWLLPWGLLAGLLLTLAGLGNGTFVHGPGCGTAAFHECGALVEGYPLRWLTAYQNVPLISKGALLKDSAQWALAGTSLFYLAWLWLAAPVDPPD